MQRTWMFEPRTNVLKGKIKQLPCIKALDFSAPPEWACQEKEIFLEGKGEKCEAWVDDGCCFGFNLRD